MNFVGIGRDFTHLVGQDLLNMVGICQDQTSNVREKWFDFLQWADYMAKTLCQLKFVSSDWYYSVFYSDIYV